MIGLNEITLLAFYVTLVASGTKDPQLKWYLYANLLPDILLFIETWLTPHDNERILGLPEDYVIHRQDRCHGRRGGGVLAAINGSLSPCTCRLEQLEHDDIELMWMSEKISTESWLVGILYCPPSSNASYWVRLREAFQTVSMNDFDGGIVLGDFNVDVNPTNQSSPNRSRLFDIAAEFVLEQLVTSVTHPHLVNPTAGFIIDLVF